MSFGGNESNLLGHAGGAFAWREGSLKVKATGKAVAGWQLLGFLQHDRSASPAFLHRTMNKWNIGEEPWPVELLTGPIPARSALVILTGGCLWILESGRSLGLWIC